MYKHVLQVGKLHVAIQSMNFSPLKTRINPLPANVENMVSSE